MYSRKIHLLLRNWFCEGSILSLISLILLSLYDITVKALDWDLRDLLSVPLSDPNFLCDFGQVI